jgi:hypothetical protein
MVRLGRLLYVTTYVLRPNSAYGGDHVTKGELEQRNADLVEERRIVPAS